MKAFSRELEASKAPEHVMPELLAALTGPLSRHGYKLESQTDAAVVYNLTYRPWWVWVLTICLFPLGLLFYLGLAEHAMVTITLEPREASGTLLRIRGEGMVAVQHAFETLAL